MSKSSFLPRLGLPRADGPILPLHSRTSPPIRKKPSEYDLSELSPRPEDGLLSGSVSGRSAPHSRRRSPSPSRRYSDRENSPSSAFKSNRTEPVLFAGPPPPIATSQMFYRDEEDRDTSLSPSRTLAKASSSFVNNINSVLFDRPTRAPAHSRDRDHDHHKPDVTWLNLQRRERALQQDLQHLLDAQSAGLAAHLDPTAPASSSGARSSSSASDAGASTPTAPIYHHHSGSSTPHRHHNQHVTFDLPPPTTTPSGTLLPVRQPRPRRPPSLRSARTGLARTMAQLADLKAEEDAQLAAAVSARKQALAQLRRLAARRDGIAEELARFDAETYGEGSMGSGRGGDELRSLEGERDALVEEIAVLEGRLADLKGRKRFLDGRMEEVRNRREAGLSGYRGALRDVEGKIGGLLSRPAVRPLDGGFFDRSGDGQLSLGGWEFLRLRPERRTAEMAREWWEGDVAVLERRQAEVDKERAALEEGLEVWKGAVQLVSDFEAGLRREMAGADGASNTKGKGREGSPTSPPPPEQAMYAQLDKMRVVMAGLDERLHVAEEKGWNLLICAIGAELEAFQQAEAMLRDALRAAGFDVGGQDDDDEGDATPHMGRSTSLRNSRHKLDGSTPDADTKQSGNLVDLHEHHEGEHESDNEVPADLLVAAEDERDLEIPVLSREDSENGVPIEFLREHVHDET